MLDQRFFHGVILGQLRLQRLLALNQLIDTLLQFDDFTGHRAYRGGRQQATADSPSQHRDSQINHPLLPHSGSSFPETFPALPGRS